TPVPAPSAFTVHYEQHLYDERGEDRFVTLSNVAYRADGSQAEVARKRWVGEQRPAFAAPFETRQVFDLANQVHVSAFPSLRRKATLPLTKRTLDSLRQQRSPSNCAVSGYRLGAASSPILGYSVVHLIA